MKNIICDTCGKEIIINTHMEPLYLYSAQWTMVDNIKHNRINGSVVDLCFECRVKIETVILAEFKKIIKEKENELE